MLVGSSPVEDATSVDRQVDYTLSFDRLLEPNSIDRGTIWIQSGAVRPLLSHYYDPHRRVVRIVTFRGRLLEPEVGYRIYVDGVRGLNGAEVDALDIPFTTGTAASPRFDPPTAPLWTDVAALLSESCSGSACHGGTGESALQLDLSSRAGVEEAIGRSAVQVQAGTLGPNGTDGSSGLFGMRLIHVTAEGGRPDLSYLVYKMLGDPLVPGNVMPPSGPLSEEAIALVVDWIEAGARTVDPSSD